MIINHMLLEEPELEFGDGGKHIDPRLGLVRHGPLQPFPGDKISIGVIGTAETVEGFERWIDRLKSAIPGSSEKQPNLFPPFPGLGNDNPFRCPFEVPPRARRVLPVRDIGQIVGVTKHATAVTAAATLFSDEATAMLEASDKPDVIVTALPFDLIMRVVNDVVVDGEDDAAERDDSPIDFRDLLKAKALHLQKPTQLAWPTLWDDMRASRGSSGTRSAGCRTRHHERGISSMPFATRRAARRGGCPARRISSRPTSSASVSIAISAASAS